MDCVFCFAETPSAAFVDPDIVAAADCGGGVAEGDGEGEGTEATNGRRRFRRKEAMVGNFLGFVGSWSLRLTWVFRFDSARVMYGVSKYEGRRLRLR